MKIYCKCYECPKNKKLDEPINFKFRKHYHESFDNLCNGECSINPFFAGYDDVVGYIRYEGAECMERESNSFCERTDCLHNSNFGCTRDEIFVDKLNDKPSCRCYSQMKVRGHMDWSRFPIGGSLDDGYADKLHYDKQKPKF